MNSSNCLYSRNLGLNCKSLQGLMLRGCPAVTESSLRVLREHIQVDRRAPELVPVPIYLQI